MKNVTLILFLMLSFGNNSKACLNGESTVLKNGTFLYQDYLGSVPYGHEFYNSTEGYKEGIQQLDSFYRATKNLDYLSDKGLLHILLKQYEYAINLYLEIEKREPNRYSTASNIGTAYELIGQNENALKWIRKSIEINNRSHFYSEWIHVKILQAKINGDKFCNSRFLLNTDFGMDSIPANTMKKEELGKLSEALYFQLNERISFVKPKERIVAQLLFDLGNIAFLLGNYRDAIEDYQQSKKYGYSDEIVDRRIKTSDNFLRTQLSEEKRKEDGNYFQSFKRATIYSVLGILIFLIIPLLIRHRKRAARG